MASLLTDLTPEHSADVPERADVVVIGGGVLGMSVAYHLVEAGVENVVLVERGRLGAGSSAKPLGGIRGTFSDPNNIRLGRHSLAAYRDFESTHGIDIGFNDVGYLFLCRTPAEVAACEASVDLQNSLGGNTRMVSPGEAQEINPLISPRALLGAQFSPEDGLACPGSVVHGYAWLALERGLVIADRTQVSGIGVSDRAVESVQTTRGTIQTRSVICCAGAWSAAIGNMVGVDLPVVPVKRQIGITRPDGGPTPPVIPFTLDLGTTMYFHNFEDRLLLGISNPGQEEGFDRDFSFDWVQDFNDAAQICAPSLSHRELGHGWAGLYENTPDRNALIGTSAVTRGFSYATGFSGHGFLQAPGVGEIMRDLHLGREPFMDPSGFSADRFSSRQVHQVSEVHII